MLGNVAIWALVNSVGFGRIIEVFVFYISCVSLVLSFLIVRDYHLDH